MNENEIRSITSRDNHLSNKSLQVIDALKGPSTPKEAQRMRDAIFLNISQRMVTPRKMNRYRDLKVALLSIAATVLLFSLIGIGAYKGGYLLPNHLLRSSISMIEVYNPNGLISTITLPDSSRVILNNNSKLTYPSTFTGDSRRITLEGEAYFEVKTDSLIPFIVSVDRLDVKVLGTKFNLKAYKNNPETILSLKEGVIEAITNHALDDTTKETIRMQPGDQLLLNKINGSLERKKIEGEWYAAWTEGKLVYRNESLHRIIDDIEQRFNVVIEITDSNLSHEKYFVSFLHGENIQQMLDLLCYKRDWKYKKYDESHFHIYK